MCYAWWRMVNRKQTAAIFGLAGLWAGYLLQPIQKPVVIDREVRYVETIEVPIPVETVVYTEIEREPTHHANQCVMEIW